MRLQIGRLICVISPNPEGAVQIRVGLELAEHAKTYDLKNELGNFMCNQARTTGPIFIHPHP